ncbi:Pirin [Roseomonas mucosa]|uniref:Quercetin 2,3-dioxygenase n=1 Tax=Roseomonas mucosa TaxID=207340 RepID=A0A379MWU8_9PROT|nr:MULTISPECIES: pirin family protein [Roseomonas]MBS5903311.1 pirin family protein [Acetobacteraceae bacterium]ATR22244.1 pirin family protein [Roseomonas sp. FDAARGOS_362]MCG7351765.1 pirin family protein [Roseomonas mucosa]MCG7356719.1 pirin family protein [Roseomonas mucosa]MDT8289441.1 pirin family protein [Roseomonas mucosa]
MSETPVEMVIEQRRRDLGGGIEVGRILPFAKRRMVGPFVFFDHMGPVDLAPGIDRSLDVRPHPHIGLSTVTYLFSGEIMHRDSIGSKQPIRPNEVNWMTAGRGITHSERFEKARAEGDRLHGIQAWVALPTGAEEADPAFSHHAGADLPQWSEGGVHGQVIAGSAYGLTAVARTHSPLFYVHLGLEAGARAEIPAGFAERALYVATGAVEMGGVQYGPGRMLVLGQGQSSLRAIGEATVMILGGEPVGPRFLYWNFVSSSKERLAQAAADWRAGRMKLPDADDREFIPLPEGPMPSAPAMS